MRHLPTTLLIGVLLAGPARADFIYVPGDYPGIQDAIDASSGGDEIIVAPGTYAESLDTLGKAIVVRASDPDPATTVIDGGGVDRGLRMDGGEGRDTVIEGFTIRNGDADHGGGARIQNASPTIRGCVFEDNYASTTGGAISVSRRGAPEIIDCVFRRNESRTLGGGVYVAGDAVIVGCDFSDNDASTGGGVYVKDDADSVRIVRCRFRTNTADFGAALDLPGPAVVINSLAHSNDGDSTVRVLDDATFINCTFDRQASGVNIDVRSGARLTATNCIMRGNAPDDLVVTGTAVVTYSNVEGGFPGVGNIDVPAGYVDGPGWDLHLGADSPCVDAGRNTAVPPQVTTDLDGIVRFINDPFVVDTGTGAGPLVDMGAYERLPELRYVVADASGASTGHTWDDAYPDLQDALDEARAGGVVAIWVAAGSYRPDRGTDDRGLAFEMVSGVEIVGGFAGGELQRDYEPRANPTVLSGAIGADGRADNSYNVVRAIDVDAEGRLIGFRVEHGSASGFGGGIHVDGGAPVIRECVVRQNEASLAGAGIYSTDADVSIHRCQVSQNVANSAVPGAGVYVLRGDALMTNSFIVGNETRGGGAGVYHLDGTMDIVNSTIFGNTSTDDPNGGVQNLGGTLRVLNTIVWGNVADTNLVEKAQIEGVFGDLDVSQSCIEGWSGQLDGVGSFGLDPLFVDADGPDDIIGTADDDVRLRGGSRCIDSADNAALPGNVLRDLDGNDRLLDDAGMTDTGPSSAPVADRGAYEFTGTTCTADVNHDGVVDFGDLLEVLTAWGACDRCAADVNLDDAVDFGDLLEVLAAWGPCP